MESMITTFNAAVTEAASEIIGKHRQEKNEEEEEEEKWSLQKFLIDKR